MLKTFRQKPWQNTQLWGLNKTQYGSRDHVARVMKTRGITGVRRGKTTFTTKTKKSDSYPADKVQRRFVAEHPNQFWVADITYVPSWTQVAYVAFVVDVFSRKIVVWPVSSTLKTEDLALRALDMAMWNLSDDLTGLVHHSDRGSNYVSLAYTERTIELGGTPSVGSKGDSYDNALAESHFALFKTKLIKKSRPWRTAEQVKLATVEWVWWFNNQRLHSEIGNVPPIEIEQAYSAEKDPLQATAIHGNT